MKSGKGKPITMDHVVFEVKDVQATVDFYEKILQFPTVRMKEFLAGDAPFPSARVNSQTLVDFFPQEFWDNRRRQQNPNHVCFTMSQSEVAALKRRLSRNKVPIIRRLPRSYGAEGWGNSIYFQDPDGVTLEARFYGKDAKKELSASAQKAQGKAALAAIKASKPVGKKKSSKS
ncbi:MAG: VOC family protein [SAR324 cluster bacterium]|nr:VOC family protein [SAR324 cluster bacterium]